MFEVLVRDMVLLLREKDESFRKLLITVSLRHLCRHNVNEVVFINGYHAFLVFVLIPALGVIRQFRDESFDLLLGRLEAESAEGDPQVLQRDVVVHVRVEELEGFLEVLALLRGQLLPVLAACLLPGRRGRRIYRLRRQRHHLRLVVLVSLLCLRQS